MRSSDSSTTSDPDTTKSVHTWTFCLESYINWSNRLSSFVTTEIIKHLKRHIRVKLLNYFIDAALECFNTGNFNSMMGILGNIYLASSFVEIEKKMLIRKLCHDRREFFLERPNEKKNKINFC
jgi:hypothetical protein